MASAHSSYFGLYASWEGYLEYSPRDVTQLVLGRDVPRASRGSRRVAEATIRVRDWRRRNGS